MSSWPDRVLYCQSCCEVASNNMLLFVQDVTIVHLTPHQAGSQNLGYNLAVFAVADGHNGSAAAMHCQELLYSELTQHLPSKPPPSAGSTGNCSLCAIGIHTSAISETNVLPPFMKVAACNLTDTHVDPCSC